MSDLLTNAERESPVTSMMGEVIRCARCSLMPVVYAGGLCHRCHKRVAAPSAAVPGTERKIELLRLRCGAKLPLWVDGDLLGDDLVAGDADGKPYLGLFNGR